jgi:predicted SAM-dependent methyltransferase
MALVSAPEAAKPLNKLNLGCGRNKLTGWQNHDAEVDITKPLPWPDNSASHIFIEHCVEHVTHKQAIEFFKQAYRVLAPGGVLRVTVPSLEQIRRCDEADYHRFTQKWAGPHGATKRGAMHAIIFAHGHEMIWTAQLLEAALFYSGFDETEICKPGESRHEPLREVEGHAREIGEKFNLIESCTVEAIKSGRIVAAAVPPPYRKAAIILGGADRWEDDYARAKEMCVRNGIQPELFYTNDHIAWLGEEGIAVTLHPDKLAKWMTIRRGRNHPPPHEIWAHRPSAKHGVTHSTEDWRGSSGLFGVACARKKGHTLILLCGIPMDANQNHFVRKAKWTACSAFQSGWRIKHADIAPYVRSLSGGFTEELLGAPTDEWINTTQGERKEAA